MNNGMYFDPNILKDNHKLYDSLLIKYGDLVYENPNLLPQPTKKYYKLNKIAFQIASFTLGFSMLLNSKEVFFSNTNEVSFRSKSSFIFKNITTFLIIFYSYQLAKAIIIGKHFQKKYEHHSFEQVELELNNINISNKLN